MGKMTPFELLIVFLYPTHSVPPSPPPPTLTMQKGLSNMTTRTTVSIANSVWIHLLPRARIAKIGKEFVTNDTIDLFFSHFRTHSRERARVHK